MNPDLASRVAAVSWHFVGTVGWPGAYGGWWQADPTDQSVLIFLAHNMLELDQMTRGIGLGVWSAIAEFHERASRT